MKSRLILISGVLMLSQVLHAQNLDDALRYSQTFYQGTARFTGMGGAFTALGGDLSAIPLNPASAALFRTSEFEVSPQLVYNKVKTSFTGTASDFTSNFSLGQIGFVSALNLGSGSGINGLTISYTYNKTNDFNMRGLIDGVSTESSMADYWASQANGYRTGELADNTSGGYMAYQTYMIDTLSGSYDQYASVFSYYGETNYTYGQTTRRIIDNSGHAGEHTIALGANIGDKLYLGASIGITTLQYTGHYQHSEIDDNQTIFDFVNFTYTDHFDADGTGTNFKIGVILRPIETLRIGFSFHTPTIYNITEYYYSNLTAVFDNDNPGDETTYNVQQDPMSYSYRLTTPYRINTGIAYQLGSSAILSADYEFVDYSTAKLSKGADGYDFTTEDDEIKSELKSTGNLRLGAEYRLGSVYLRGGYRYYGSAFRDGTLNQDRDYSGYSAGIGYRQKGFYVDFSYAGMISSEQYMMYPDAYLEPTTIKSNNKMFTASIGLKF